MQNKRFLRDIVLFVWLFVGVALVPISVQAEEDVPQINWPPHASAACQNALNTCFSPCFHAFRKIRDPQGNPYSTRVIALFCYKKCWNQHVENRTCKGKKIGDRPPTAQETQPPASDGDANSDIVGLPNQVEVSKLSPFCRKFLGICTRSCIRQNAHLRDKQGQPYPLSVLRIFCSGRCWGLPARVRVCQLKREELLEKSSTLLKQSQQELQSAEKEEQLEQQRLLVQQKKAEQQRLLEEVKQRQEQELRKKQDAWRRAEAKRLAEQRKELAKELQELQELRKQRKRETEKLAQEQQQRLALQQKQFREQQRRLKILKKQMAEREKQAKSQKLLLKKQREEQERILNAQKSELVALRKQRLDYQKKVSEVQQSLVKEQALAQQKKQLEKHTKEPQDAVSRRKYKKQLSRVKKELAQLKRKKQDFQKSRKSFKTRRQKRRKRLAMLRKKFRHTGRRRRASSTKQKAQTAFNRGQFDLAKKLFQAAKDASMLEKIDEFKSVFQNGKQNHDSRNPDVALPDLERALTLDLEIGGNQSNFTSLLQKMLANMYTMKGRLSMSRQFYSSAFIYFSAARRYQFDHLTANQQLAELKTIASQFVKRAGEYPKSSTFRRQLLRKAVRLIPKDDPLYKQIQTALEEP